MFKIFEKMFKETKDFDDVMIKNKDSGIGTESLFCEGYVITNKDSMLNIVGEDNEVKLIPGENIIVDGDVYFYKSLQYIWCVPIKVFKLKIECIKFVDDQYSNGTTAYGVKSVFVEKEMSFDDLESAGLFGECGKYKFINNEEDYNRAKEIIYSDFVIEKTKTVMKKLGYGEKFTNLLLYKFKGEDLYNKIKLIETMESENVPKKLIVFSILSDSKFDIKDILNFGGNIYEQ